MSTTQKRRNLTTGVAAFFLLLWVLLTHSHVNSWKDISHLATVEALVHHGTWAIDDTAMGRHTGDRIFLNGHFYSDRPPTLSLLASGVYAVLHRGFHLSLDPWGCDPDTSSCYCFALLCPQPPDWAYYLLTLTLVGLPSALMLALFYRSTALHSLPNPLALLLTGILGLGWIEGTLPSSTCSALSTSLPVPTCGHKMTISPATPPIPLTAGSLARWCWIGFHSWSPPMCRPGSTC